MGNFIFLKEIVEFRGKQPVRAHFIFFFPVRMGNLLNASKHTTSCDLNRKCRRTGEEHSLAFDYARLACFLCKAVSPHQTGFQMVQLLFLECHRTFPSTAAETSHPYCPSQRAMKRPDYIPPFRYFKEYRQQTPAFLRQGILSMRRDLIELLPVDDAKRFQIPQCVRKHGVGNVRISPLQFAEPHGWMLAQLINHMCSPLSAQQFKRPVYGAILLYGAGHDLLQIRLCHRLFLHAVLRCLKTYQVRNFCVLVPFPDTEYTLYALKCKEKPL